MGDSDKSCDLETDTTQQVDQSKESSDYEKEQEALLDKQVSDILSLINLSLIINNHKFMKLQIIMDEVFILSWQSHVQFNLPVLITEEILDVFIRYLSESPNMDLKAARALKRIARSENMIERFILLQFHTRVLHTLSRINCRLNRYIERCEYCWERAEYADEILREFALHVDSPLGSALIKDYFKSSNVIHRVKTSIMLVQLIR
ncbi:unnamed protein product, partial [Anisakis simplex]|uniref:Uncharacterized protein n=1 Tax=Anisakis simplex TaxID=6269 RepID=A0A0M3JEB7_ANISI